MASSFQEAISPHDEGTWGTRLIVHDMRTPLNALLLNLQEIARLGGLDAEQKQCLQSAETNARVLARLIDEILVVHAGDDWSRESLSLHECVPEDLIARAIDQVSAIAARKSIDITVNISETLPLVLVDPEKIIRVLVNLLSNSIKFTDLTGHIIIEAHPRTNDGHSTIVFSVEDNGIGISEHDVNRIFLEGVSRAGTDGTSSTGLGLTVSRQIIEAHGGRIWAEPGRIDGSTFSFALPAEH